MRYDVQFKPAAVKDIKDIPASTQSRILAKIEAMSDDLKGDQSLSIVSVIDAKYTDRGGYHGRSESSDYNKRWEERIRDHPLR